MDDAVQFEEDSCLPTLRNPERRPDPELEALLETRKVARRRRLASRNESLLSPDAKRELLHAQAEAWRAIVEPLGVDYDAAAAVALGAAAQANERVEAALEARQRKWGQQGAATFDRPGPPMTIGEPADHSFWWAETQPFAGPGVEVRFDADMRVHFGSYLKTDYGGDLRTSFGALVWFELQPGRMPNSQFSFHSYPAVELEGILQATTWGLTLPLGIQIDGSASCSIYLRQSIFQVELDRGGPRFVEKNMSSTYLKNYIHASGYLGHDSEHLEDYSWPIPAVHLPVQSVNTKKSLFAEIEVMFYAQAANSGSLYTIPPTVLRPLQWPLLTS